MGKLPGLLLGPQLSLLPSFNLNRISTSPQLGLALQSLVSLERTCSPLGTMCLSSTPTLSDWRT